MSRDVGAAANDVIGITSAEFVRMLVDVTAHIVKIIEMPDIGLE